MSDDLQRRPPDDLKPPRSTGMLILKIFLISIGAIVLLGLAAIGLVLFMCSRH